MIFYIDTSTSFLYAALYKDEKVIDKITLNLGKELSSKALALINEMFKKNNLEFNNIDKIIAVNGPGSFTGVRVGLTIAKTIAWSINKPIITISSIEAMALSCNDDFDYVIPIIDARRNYYYSGIFDMVNNMFVLKEQYISYDLIMASAKSLPGKIAVVTNDSFDSDFDIEKYEPNYERIINFVKDREPTDVHLVDANYLKKTEAEENKNDN